MSDNVKVDVYSISNKMISDLATAIGESVGQHTTKLGDFSRMSRGGMGLGVSDVSQKAQEAAQANIRGFTGGSIKNLVANVINPGDVFAQHTQDSGRMRAEADKLALQRAALGINPNRTAAFDPALYGGRFSLGQGMRMASDALNSRASTGKGDPFGANDARLVNAAALLRKGAAYAPIMEKGFAGAQRVYQAGQGLTASGAAQGVNPNNQNLFGGLMQSPFNAAAIRGGMSKLDALQMSMTTGGLNNDQAQGMQNQIFSQGYGLNSPNYGRMKDAYKSIISGPNGNQTLNDPRVATMLDASNRFQSQGALESFVGTMQRLPSVAAGASISIDRLLTGMTKYVGVAVAGGALPQEAAKAFSQQTNSTGIPGDVLQNMEQNPIIKGQFVRNGVAPWDVSRQTGGVKTMAEQQGLKTIYSMYGGRGTSDKQMDSEANRSVIARIMQNHPELGSATEIKHMLGLTAASMEANRKGGEATDRLTAFGMGAGTEEGYKVNASGKNLKDLGKGQQMKEIRQWEKANNIRGHESDLVNKQLYDSDGKLKDDWESQLYAAKGAKTAGGKGEALTTAMKNPLGNAGVGDLMKKVADLMTQISSQLTNAK